MNEPSIGTRKRTMTENAKLAIYAVVAVVVGLVGFAVSGQFESIQATTPDPPVAGPGPETSTTINTTSTSLENRTTDPSAEVSTPTTSAGPAVFSVSVDTVDFGDDGTVDEIRIANVGGQAGQFTVSASTEVVILASGAGELAAGESIPFQIGLDRDTIEEGELEATVTVAWEGGEETVAIAASQVDNPIIHNPQASPSEVQVDGECAGGRTSVSARIRDTSEFTGLVRWSPDGGSTRETEMVSVGNEIYEAEIGPFTSVGVKEARIVATDTYGNAGGATVNINVTDCA